jgi:hypothetical protein
MVKYPYIIQAAEHGGYTIVCNNTIWFAGNLLDCLGYLHDKISAEETSDASKKSYAQIPNGQAAVRQ